MTADEPTPEPEAPEPVEVPEPIKPKGYNQQTGEFVA